MLTAMIVADALQVAPDIDARLAKWKRVEMPFTMEGMSAREKRLVTELIAACRDLENIYWRQSDPHDIDLFTSTKDRNLRRLLWIHGSRYDLLEENQPFIGTEPMPPDRALYPPGSAAHPKESSESMSGTRRISRSITTMRK